MQSRKNLGFTTTFLHRLAFLSPATDAKLDALRVTNLETVLLLGQ